MKTESRRRFWIVLLSVFALVSLTSAGAYAAYQATATGSAASLAQADDDTTVPTETSIYDLGVLVTSVDASKPAADAGVRRGSIILAVDGVDVNTPEALIDAIESAGPGATVTVTVLNSPDAEELTVTLSDEKPLLGVRLYGAESFGRMEPYRNTVPPLPFSPDEREPFTERDRAIDPAPGALIAAVEPDSPAALAGLESGDIITAVDGDAIADVEALVALVGAKAPGDRLSLTVERNGEEKSALIVLGENPEDATRGFMGVLVAPAMPVDPFPNQGQDGQGFDGEPLPFAFGELEQLFPEGFDLEQLFPGGLFGFGEDGTITPEDLESFFSGELSAEELEKLFPDGLDLDQLLPGDLFGFGLNGEPLTPEQLEALLSGTLTEEELADLFPDGVPSLEGLDQLLPPEFFAPFIPDMQSDMQENDA